MSETTTISLPKRVKAELDSVKLHRREPYYEVIERLIKTASKVQQETKQSKPAEKKKTELEEIFDEE